MRRRLLNCIAAVMLVLSAVFIAAAVAGFWVYPRLVIEDWNKTSYMLFAIRGELCFNLQYSAFYPETGEHVFFAAPPAHTPFAPFPADGFWNRRGFWARVDSSLGRSPPAHPWKAPAWFGWIGLVHDKPVSSLTVAIPLWLLILMPALLPTCLIWRFVRTRRRIGDGHCRNCGYDLRATPDRCPECGTMVRPEPST
jgi:hypothetical protein